MNKKSFKQLLIDELGQDRLRLHKKTGIERSRLRSIISNPKIATYDEAIAISNFLTPSLVDLVTVYNLGYLNIDVNQFSEIL